MKDLYKAEEDCLAFSDETLEKYFFGKIIKEPDVELVYSYFDDEYSELFLGDIRKITEIYGGRSDYLDKVHKISSVAFDGEKGDFDIQFLNSAMTSIFALGENFMFIDDAYKKDARGIVDCIIYEGSLRDKTHEQILDIMFQLFKILKGTAEISYEEHFVSKIGFYRINNYTVKLNKPGYEKQNIQFENITFLIN